ncbi:MAG: cysteine desulfurase family protein [Candidatus Bathyarchaeota archaeon]|jgi:cysteine desulfurase|nr:cysteine desulfurase family protein [Candidatus Bathyarchaeota archaeon]
MSMKVYMDHGAGKPVDPRVLEVMTPYFMETYGNPASFHGKGFDALKSVNRARQQVASLIGAEAVEIVFTSSATEANNLGIGGATRRYKKKGNRIVLSAIEHISSINVGKELYKEGFEVKYAPVNNQGIVELRELEGLVNDKTILVSVMTANGEIGTIQPIEKAMEIAHRNGALFHTDATAAAGQIAVNTKSVDFMTISSNELYGPKGVGALYIKKGLRVKPQMIGGGQENGIRSGSENVPGIVGMGAAADFASAEMGAEGKRLSGLRDALIGGVIETIPESYLNGHPSVRLPNNANIRFSYIEGEALILSLDQLGINVSSGSACTAKTLEPSHVLRAIGLKHEEAHGSLVYTLGKVNNKAHVNYVIEQMSEVVGRLRAMSPLTPEELR